MTSATKSAAELYGAAYFEHSCGRPYRRDEHWLGFFGAIADRIVEEIAPRTVLDAGCAMGFLVEALRDRGVEAYGVDISEYALAQVREDIRPHCRLASLTEPLDRAYDLIVSIEVLEHLEPRDAEEAIDNLCEHADEVLFSSTPSDFDEPTHVNVRPTSYWVTEFARRGLVPDAAYDASYITPWARRFRKDGYPAWRALEGYERRLATLTEENIRLGKRLAHHRRQIDVLERTRTFRYRRAALDAGRLAKKTARRLLLRERPVVERARAKPVPHFRRVRSEVAARWLGGAGIEIGALHQPLEVPAAASVRYVDRLPLADLRLEYPELSREELVEPDVVDDGERLSAFNDESVDFVIANHFLEHCEDPIGALQNALRVVRLDGFVYLAVPDKWRTFDHDRPVTSIGHLDRDHRDGPGASRAAHYEEFVRFVERPDDVESRARELLERSYSIHFHVWTADSFRSFLEHCRDAHSLPFRLAEYRENDFEVIAVLQKNGDGIRPGARSSSPAAAERRP